METVTITIDGQPYEVEKGIPLVLAAERAGVRIPHLCFHEGLSVFAGCRVCVVQIDGARGLPTSCTTLTADGQVVWTKTPEVLDMQRGVMSLILADHPDRCLSCQRQEHCGIDGICLRDAVVTYRCLTCAKNKRCEFQSTSEELEMHKYPMRYYQERHSWYGPDHVELPIKRDNPFIELDFNECILCARCVRACDEVRGLSCYELTYKGPQARIDTAFSLPLQAVGCDGCGACVDVCPVACILDKPSKWQGPAQRVVTTTCPYCGDGCQLEVEVKNERVLRTGAVKAVEGVPMVTCASGRNALGLTHSPLRVTTPLVRRNGVLEPATWDEAAALVAGHLRGQSPGDVAAVLSPDLTNEETFAAREFLRTALGSPQIRLAGAEADRALVAPLEDALGVGAATGSLDDLSMARCVFLMGADLTTANPIAAWQVRRATRFTGSRLIVASPWSSEFTGTAGIWLRYRPGTGAALLAGLLHVIIAEGLAAGDFIAAHCEGFDALQETVAAWTPERASGATGIPAADIGAAARAIATSGGTAFAYDPPGVAAAGGRDAVAGLVNLALATGSMGRPGAGLFPLRATSNQQGAEDLGHRPAGTPPAAHTLLLVGPRCLDGDTALRSAAQRTNFVLAVESYYGPATDAATVVLPAASFAEQEGTRTNSERRVQRARQVVPAVGEARPVWAAVGALAAAMGRNDLNFPDATSVFERIRAQVPAYHGMTHARLEAGALQWPCPEEDHPGTPVLFAAGFGDRKARFIATPPAATTPATPEFPLLLATGVERVPFHREVLARREDPATRSYDEELLLVHPTDALRFDLADGQPVPVETPDAAFTARCAVSDRVPPGTLRLTLPVVLDPAGPLGPPEAETLQQLPPLAVARIATAVPTSP